jgi:hypothetical protein
MPRGPAGVFRMVNREGWPPTCGSGCEVSTVEVATMGEGMGDGNRESDGDL